MPRFRLVGSDKDNLKKDKQKKGRGDSTEDETPKTFHFPEHTPWGDRKNAEHPQHKRGDILDTIERQIDRAQESLERLAEDTDVLFRMSDLDQDDDTPSAA
ncbi:MAG: hypothetical protein H6813_04620 [Phycisphaeraceae bacterium]|nr:hypothetical protein [Phycisphaeraceae bacterium]MCB9847233.1 hypothetical protein [Phycisphaeraceae bacterium]